MGQNYSQLSQKERDQIAIYRSKSHSFSEIGEMLGRNGSTISREYNRNITEEGSVVELMNNPTTRIFRTSILVF